MIKPGIKVLLSLIYFLGAKASFYRPQLSISLSNSPVQTSRILDSGRGYESEKEEYSFAQAKDQLRQVKNSITSMIQAQAAGKSKQFEQDRQESQKLLNTISGGLSKLAPGEIPQIFEELRKERARYNSFCVSPKWQVTAGQPSSRLSLTKPHKPLLASRDQKTSRSESKLDLTQAEKMPELIIAPTGVTRPKTKPPVPLFSDSISGFTPVTIQKDREPEKAQPLAPASAAVSAPVVQPQDSIAQRERAELPPKKSEVGESPVSVPAHPAAPQPVSSGNSVTVLTKQLVAYACVTGFVAWLIHKIYNPEEPPREQLRSCSDKNTNRH